MLTLSVPLISGCHLFKETCYAFHKWIESIHALASPFDPLRNSAPFDFRSRVVTQAPLDCPHECDEQIALAPLMRQLREAYPPLVVDLLLTLSLVSLELLATPARFVLPALASPFPQLSNSCMEPSGNRGDEFADRSACGLDPLRLLARNLGGDGNPQIS